MAGQLTEVGSLSLGAAVPMLGLTGAQLSAAATLSLGEISGKIEGLVKIVAALTVPQVPALAIAGAGAALLSLEATVTAPDPTLQLQAVTAALLELQASLADAQAQLAFAASLGDLLSSPGIAMYTYSGTADSLGAEVSAHTAAGIAGGGAPGDQVNAILLATSVPSTRVAMAEVFGA